MLVSRQQARSLGLTPGNCFYNTPKDAVFGDSVKLLGVDLPRREFRHDQPIVISRYWTLAHDENRLSEGDYTIELSVETATGAPAGVPASVTRLLHRTLPCYGTFPASMWQPGESVVETYSVPLPRDLPDGVYSLNLVVKDPHGLPLRPNRDDHYSACFLTNIQIRR